MMVEDNQIPRCGHTLGKNRQSSLDDGLEVDNVPGPNQWPSHWLTASFEPLENLSSFEPFQKKDFFVEENLERFVVISSATFVCVFNGVFWGGWVGGGGGGGGR